MHCGCSLIVNVTSFSRLAAWLLERSKYASYSTLASTTSWFPSLLLLHIFHFCLYAALEASETASASPLSCPHLHQISPPKPHTDHAMDNDKTTPEVAPTETPPSPSAAEQGDVVSTPRNKLMKVYANNWSQIILISFICFCCPGMYNALTGLGGSGQVDSTVAANANVALLSCTAGTALFIGAPLFWKLGPKILFLLGGWTYALYSGSLLSFNHNGNGAFVIGAGAILGVGASFLWVVQGAIMTSYVAEKDKGKAIAVFWIIFNRKSASRSLLIHTDTLTSRRRHWLARIVRHQLPQFSQHRLELDLRGLNGHHALRLGSWNLPLLPQTSPTRSTSPR